MKGGRTAALQVGCGLLRLDYGRIGDEHVLPAGEYEADRLALHLRGHTRHDIVDDRAVIAIYETHVSPVAGGVRSYQSGRGRPRNPRQSTRRRRGSIRRGRDQRLGADVGYYLVRAALWRGNRSAVRRLRGACDQLQEVMCVLGGRQVVDVTQTDRMD